MKKIMFVLLCGLMASQVFGYDFKDEGSGLCFDIVSNTEPYTVEVVKGDYSGLTTAFIPESVTYGEKTYSVTSIGDYAFSECFYLNSVTIPNSVTSIGDYAFNGCRDLRYVSIPNSVTSIGPNAFYNALNIYYIRYDHSFYLGNDENPYYYLILGDKETSKVNNNCKIISKRAFCSGSKMSHLVVPNAVTTIGESAFIDVEVLIYGGNATGSPWGAKTIYPAMDDNFYYFDAAKTQIAKYIGKGTEVTIPETVTSIGANAFSRGPDLLTIPETVTSIGNNAFSGVCNIVYNGKAEGSPWGATLVNGIVDGDFIYADSEKTILVKYIGNGRDVNIPEGVVRIKSKAISGLSIETISIPNSVTFVDGIFECYNLQYNVYGNANYLGNVDNPYLFLVGHRNDNVKTIEINGDCKIIGDAAFDSCSGLISVSIPNSVTSIGNNAFYGCSGLTSVTIPNSVIEIGQSAFSGVNSIYFKATSPDASWNNIGGKNEYYVPCDSRTTYINKNAYFKENAYRLYEYTYIVTVFSGENGSVAITQQPACDDATAIVKATPNLGYKFKQWSDGSTQNPYQFTATSDTSLTATFEYVGTATVTLESADFSMGSVSGEGEYTIGSQAVISADASDGYAFSHWNDGNTENPRTITVTEDVTYTAYFLEKYFGVGDFVYEITGENTVAVIQSIDKSSVEIPESVSYKNVEYSVTGINGCAFLNCYNYLTMVTIPKSVTSIKDNAFAGSIVTKLYFKATSPNPSWRGWEVNEYYVPCGSRTTYINKNAYFKENADFLYEYSYLVTAISAGNGSVAITQQPTCDDATAIFKATPDLGYKFKQWSDGSTQNPYQFTATSDTSLTATFEYVGTATVTLESDDYSMGSVSGEGIYTVGSQTVIIAEASDDYVFDHWNDGNTENSRTITVTEDVTYTAYFVEGRFNVDGIWYKIRSFNEPYTVWVTYENSDNDYENNYSGLTTVTIPETVTYDGKTYSVKTIGGYSFKGCTSLSSVIIGDSVESINGFAFDYCTSLSSVIIGKSVTEIGNSFRNCNSLRSVTILNSDVNIFKLTFPNCCLTTLTIPDFSIDLSALFGSVESIYFLETNPKPIRYWVSANKYYVPCGTLATYANMGYPGNYEYSYLVSTSSAGNGIADIIQQPTCDDATAIVKATPNLGYKFKQWSDGSTQNPYQFTATSDTSLTATFEYVGTATVSLASDDYSMGGVRGGGEYTIGSQVVIVANASEGYGFDHWNDGNTENPRTITVTEDVTYTAYFGKGYEVQLSASDLMGYKLEREPWDEEPYFGPETNGAGRYVEGRSVDISASCNTDDYKFVRWSDNNTEPVRTIVVNEDIHLTAYFAHKATLDLRTEGEGSLVALTNAPYYQLDSVELLATPASGWAFYGWNGVNKKDDGIEKDIKKDDGIMKDNKKDNDIVESNNIKVELNYQTNVFTAIFAPKRILKLWAVGNGTTVGAGEYAQGRKVQVKALPGNGSHFVKWSDGSTESVRYVYMDTDKNLAAQFAVNTTQYTLELSSNDGGVVVGAGQYVYGSKVEISAVANKGYHFVAWNDGVTDAVRTVTVECNASLSAKFEANGTFNVEAWISGNGNVDGQGRYVFGDTATLTAIPETGWVFVEWNDGVTDKVRSFEVRDNVTLVALFEEDLDFVATQLEATVNDTTMGVVEGCGIYNRNSEVELSAIANNGYHFVAWNDGNAENPRTVTLSGDTTFVASFAKDIYKVTVSAGANGTVAGSGSFEYLSNATINATPADGYHFVSWSNGDTASTRTLVIVSDTTLVATFGEHVAVVDSAINFTCVSMGMTEGKHCAVCDAVLVKREYIMSPGHDYSGDFVVDAEPTCTVAGQKSKTCTRCGKVLVETIPALGHDIVMDLAEMPTCTTPGKSVGMHCSVCNEVFARANVVPALGHDFSGTFTVDVEPTCTEQGSKSKHCSRCDSVADVTVIDSLGHSWGVFIYNNNATVEANGTETSTCTRPNCDETMTREAEGTRLKVDIEGETANALVVYSHHNVIVVENAAADIEVYDATGRLVAHRDVACNVSITMPREGLYIVKCGAEAKRVSVSRN